MINEDLSFHAQTGVRVIYSFQNPDGSLRDMTGKLVEVVVSNGFRKALEPVAGETNKMSMLLLGSELSSILKKSAQYIVLDQSDTPPFEVASGNLTVTGWL